MEIREIELELEGCVRDELYDPLFGDTEVYFRRNVPGPAAWVADGYKKPSANVFILYFGDQRIEGKDAERLMEVGIIGKRERN